MGRPVISIRLRETLGPEASEDLGNTLEEVKKDMLLASHDRFESRLGIVAADMRAELTRTQSELRQELVAGDAALRVAFTEGLSRIRAEMADLRADVLRWSFVFWVGQVVATATLLAVMLRLLTRP
jgi:hypothetical protein